MQLTDKLNNVTVEDYLGYKCYNFTVIDTPCIVVKPKNPCPGKKWVWKAEFFKAFPGFDQAMLEHGYWICYMNVGNTFGCPDSMNKFNEFYRFMTEEQGFDTLPVLEGLSRGGLYVYNWAANNPDKVGMIYADNPVCDFKSWPGGTGAGPGSAGDWEKLLESYHFNSEEEALNWAANPVDNLEVIVKHQIPMVHIYGNADEVVPWQENTAVVAEKVKQLGGSIKLIEKEGCKHHPHGPEEPESFADWVIENIKVNTGN